MPEDTVAAPLLQVKPQHMTLTDATSEALHRAILDGTFASGSQLPPELELIRMLGVSRTTLREALKRLEEQGLIVRRRGLGTYVREKSIVKDLNTNFGISEMITAAGMKPGTRATAVRQEKATTEAATALAIAEGAPVVVVERVRTADRRPVVLSLDILPAELLGDRALNSTHLQSQSLYKYFSDELQIRVLRGVARLSPVAATAEMADKLDVRRGTPLLRIAQTDYDAADRPVLHSIEYHLPDAFVFVINRRGPHW
jgi:GntR family transcriptional regulator